MNEEMLHALSAEFSPDLVRKRQGPGGKSLSYIEAAEVIARLNEVLGGRWSFNVIEHRVHGDEVVVVGRLVLHTEPDQIVKEAFGGASLQRDRDGNVVAFADTMKSAASDALKKAATLANVALHLYRDRDNGSPSNGNGNNGKGNNGNGSRNGKGQDEQSDDSNMNGNGRVTSAQLATLRRLVDELHEGDWRRFRQTVTDRFGAVPEYLGRRDASTLIGEMIDESRRRRSQGRRAVQ